MVVEHVQGDMFADLAPGTALAHGVNCLGLMGAGVAKIVRDRYPSVYDSYRDHCVNRNLFGGDSYLVEDEVSGRRIFNLASQFQPGPNAHIEYLIDSILRMDSQAKHFGITTVHMPRIGCGIGGLNWHTSFAGGEHMGVKDALSIYLSTSKTVYKVFYQ